MLPRAANAPLSIYANTSVRWTGTPEAAAVRTLRPEAYSHCPIRVLDRTQWQSAQIASASGAMTIRLDPGAKKDSGIPGTLDDFVIHNARPLKNIMVVSVTMNGGMRTYATAAPFAAPAASPVASMTPAPARA